MNMNTHDTTPTTGRATTVTRTRRVVFVAAAVLVLLSFFGAYAFAASRPSSDAAFGTQGAAADGASGACGCCGTGASGPVVSGTAVIEGDVQRISVDVSTGTFVPGEIVLAAGVPAEITFGQGQGCLAEVLFGQFGIVEDLTSGGAVIRLPALDPGTYEFSCGMRMIFGTLVVR